MRDLTRVIIVVCVLTGLLAGVSAANTTNIHQPYVVDPNTVALYHFDGDWTDEVGNHPGAPAGGVTFDGGRFDQGLSVDGVDDYVRAGNVHRNPSRDTRAGTVEAWVMLADVPTHFVVLGSGVEYGGTWDDGFFLGRHSGYGGDLMFGLWGPGWQFAHSGIDPADLVGQWHHLAGTWGPRGIELWLDNEVVAAIPSTIGLVNPNYGTMLIGTDSWRWHTSGLIDEVRVSDIQRVLVPEPATATLVVLGALAGLYRRRR